MNFIYGLNKSGKSVLKLLLKQKKPIFIWDDDKKVRNRLEKIYGKNIFLKPSVKTFNNFKNIYVSPGISIRKKIFDLKNKTKKLKRDLNLYLKNLNSEKIIAVTGTNGKSTTTKLIGETLKTKNTNTFIGGNIGFPLCNSIISTKKFNLTCKISYS